MFEINGYRTIDLQRGLELSSVGGRGTNRRSIIHTINDENDIKIGPVTWTIVARDIDATERGNWPTEIKRTTIITVTGPWKGWSTLQMPGVSRGKSLEILREALTVWPQIQGPDFIKKNAVDVRLSPDVATWVERG